MKAAAVTPLVFDLQDALAPISADQPAGESLRYDALFDEIKELRREDDSTLPQGVWKRDFKKADWSRVATLALEALQTRTKDLQVAAWLVEAWTHLHGFSGTELGLKLVTGLCTDFWDDVHPQLEEGPEFRLAPLEWLATRATVAIKTIPVSSPETDDALAYTWADWERSLHLAQQIEADQISEEQAESEGKLNKAKFLASVSLTSSAFYMRIADEVRRSLAAVDELAAVLAQKLPETAPSFSELRTTIEAIERFVVRNLQERMEDVEPPGGDREAQDAATAGLDEDEAVVAPAGGPITSRADAYRRLNHAAEYLLRSEPHSPAPYLVKRAVSWGGLTLAELLQELLEQNTDLGSIYKLLGIRHIDKR